jgi:hypothetical protein
MTFGQPQPGSNTIVPPAGPLDVTFKLPVVELPHEFRIGPNDPRRELKTLGKCIYCGATEFEPGSGQPLSEEHFFGEGLGSRLVLLEASCKVCAIKTSNIERRVLQQSLLIPRVRFGIRRKKRKRTETPFSGFSEPHAWKCPLIYHP